MTDELSRTIFENDLEEAKAADEASRWSLDHRGGLEVWVTVSPEGHDAEKYTARLCWSRYPDDLPSVKFVDTETSALGVGKAWPNARGFRPPNDICATWTLEGHQTHPEWRNDARYRWQGRGNVLLLTIRTLQSELDESYQGRFST